MNLDFSSVRVVRVHKPQYDAIEQKAKSVLLTCVEDGRCMMLNRSEYTECMVICVESSADDLHIGDIIFRGSFNDAHSNIEYLIKKIMVSKGITENHFDLLRDGVEFTDLSLNISQFEVEYIWWEEDSNSDIFQKIKKSVEFRIVLL